MKKFISFIIVIIIISMLIAPTLCTAGSKYGVELWLFTVLPTLLPFIILSNILVNMNVCKSIAGLVHPIMKRLFHTSIYGSYAILIGLLCGYPMGAKTISDLVDKKHISQQEGQYLLSFCNNPSPMYLLGYIAAILEINRHSVISILIIIYISAYISSVIYRKYHYEELLTNAEVYTTVKSDSDNKSIWQTFESSILNGFSTIAKLGGYIIIFSIIVKLITNISIVPSIVKALCACLIEITSGAYYISQMQLSIIIKTVIIISTTMFGGLSINSQTAGVLSNSALKFSSYIKYKIISAVICALLIFLYSYIFL